MDVVIGALLVIIILVGIAVLRRRLRSSIPLRTLEDLQRNRDECQAVFDDAEHDLTLARNIKEQTGQPSWAELCRQLGREGRNPALHDLTETPDDDEPAARNLFETAVFRLGQVYDKAKDNLEMATILVEDENEEA
jgi:NAD-dependent oxidoreductase involved in siderophore biosynthesis